MSSQCSARAHPVSHCHHLIAASAGARMPGLAEHSAEVDPEPGAGRTMSGSLRLTHEANGWYLLQFQKTLDSVSNHTSINCV